MASSSALSLERRWSQSDSQEARSRKSTSGKDSLRGERAAGVLASRDPVMVRAELLIVRRGCRLSVGVDGCRLFFVLRALEIFT